MTSIRTSITLATLNAVAADLDAVAREMAHNDVAPCTPAEYVWAYLRCLAGVLGAQASVETASGEPWAPSGWLDGDWEAMQEAARLLHVEEAELDWRALFALYASPSDAVYEACGLDRPSAFDGASICVEIGPHTIDPQGIGSDEENAACEAFILDAVREAYPTADVRAVGRGGRTGAVTRWGDDFTDEVKAVVNRAYSDFFAG